MNKGRGEKLKAVVDTNLFVRGLISKLGNPFVLLEALRREEFLLVISQPLRREYEEVLRRPKFAQKYGLTPKEIADFLFLVDSNARKITPLPVLPLQVRDVKDEKVLAAALGDRVDFLVTSDDDLLVLRGDPRLGTLQIVTVREFLNALRA
jgi:putative PIN family toxin of toxin-antitoxin system